MRQIILLISLAAVLVGIVVAQDDGTFIQNLRSVLAKADQQPPDGALVQDVGKEEQLKDLESLLAKTQDDGDDSLADVEDFDKMRSQDVEDQMALPRAQDSWQTTAQEDDLDSLLAESQHEDELLQKVLAGAQNGIDDGNENAVEQDDKEFLKKLFAGKQGTALEQQDDDDEEALAQNVYDNIDEQISAEEQDLESPALAQDNGQKQVQTQRYRYWARYYNRYYNRYYKRYYSRHYARYYNKYYKRYYGRYYNRYYSRYYNRQLNNKKRYYINYYSRYYNRYYSGVYNRYYSRYYWRYYRRACNRRKTYWSG